MTFVGELYAALERPHPGESADAVHELVGNALRRLDPTIEIKRTHYFTHTFVPDLVLRWGPGDARKERHVHLRFSVTTPVFAEDLELLSSDSPLFIGMTERDTLASPGWATDGHGTNGTLVTEAHAIDDLDETAGNEARARAATGAIVRIGHGILDKSRAGVMGSSYIQALRAVDSSTGELSNVQLHVEGALALINEYLPELGQLEVERSLQAEWIRHGRDPYDFPSQTPWNPELLDMPALRHVLLSLLESTTPVLPETWQRNAGFVTAEDIGRVLGRDLRGGSFHEMAHSLVSCWARQWVCVWR